MADLDGTELGVQVELQTSDAQIEEFGDPQILIVDRPLALDRGDVVVRVVSPENL
jgi:hypothetical protein